MHFLQRDMATPSLGKGGHIIAAAHGCISYCSVFGQRLERCVGQYGWLLVLLWHLQVSYVPMALAVMLPHFTAVHVVRTPRVWQACWQCDTRCSGSCVLLSQVERTYSYSSPNNHHVNHFVLHIAPVGRLHLQLPALMSDHHWAPTGLDRQCDMVLHTCRSCRVLELELPKWGGPE